MPASTQLAVLRWLSDTDPSSNHNLARHIQEPETGTWLVENPEYRKWRDQTGQLLWLHGIAGSGKTVLCSTVIENLSAYIKELDSDTESESGLAYFYFDFRTPAKLTCQGMLRSLLRQLSCIHPTLPESTQTLFDECARTGHQPGEVNLYKALCEVIAASERCYLVIDALDECPMRQDVLNLVIKISEHTNQKASILITSRQEIDIEETLLEGPKDNIVRIGIEQWRVKDDINKFVSTRLTEDRSLCRWTEQRSKLATELIGGADGMYDANS